MSPILAIANTAETEVELCSDNVLDGFIFEGSKLSSGFVLFVSCIEQRLRALERAEVFGAKGRATVEGERHDGWFRWDMIEIIEDSCWVELIAVQVVADAF